MARIGGFSDKNFTEDLKIAQTAQQSADNASKKIDDKGTSFQESLDKKIIIAKTTPGNDDSAGHDKGDVWYVTNDSGVYTDMYRFDGVSWIKQKWDQASLSVKQLSALSADLGYIQAGTLDAVNISAATFTGGTITGSTLSLKSGEWEYYLDYNGFHVDSNITGDQTWLFGAVINLGGSRSNPTVVLSSDGINTGSKRINTNGMTMSAGSVFGVASGTLYIEQGDGSAGWAGADIYAKSYNKKSTLSIKYDITDLPTDYALAQILGTDIKRYNYKKSDNAQQTNIGPIIDDENKIGELKYNLSEDLLTSKEDGISIDNEVGLLIASIQELVKRQSELNFRILTLERNANK